MSTGLLNLQAQVESVLGALVKAASVELIKLFESRYGASAADVGHSEDKVENITLETLGGPWNGNTKRSIGVQVEEDIYPLLELSDTPFLSDVGCLRQINEMVVEGCLISSEILLPEHSDHESSPLKDQILADAVEMGELNVLEAEFPADNDAQTELVLHADNSKVDDTCNRRLEEDLQHLTAHIEGSEPPKEMQSTHPIHLHSICAGAPIQSKRVSGGMSQCGSTPSSPAKQNPIVIKVEASDTTSEEKVKFVCPLVLKPESPAPKPESLEKPIQAEPQQAVVSTAKGTAYSPSSCDGAVTPTQAGVWEWIHSPKDTTSHLQMKLKLASPDQKLMRPCAVQLVNVLTVPESEIKTQSDSGNTHNAKHKSGWPLPKDLRRHQGLHTGHRLCCFTQCENGIWRLQNIVSHSRDGYVCNICGKVFKHRKVLRRHGRFHTGEKPYSCSKCSKTFALRKSLRRHSRFHTGERPHTCSQCGKSFRLRGNLKAHLRFHSGEKPFSCDSCGKTFRIMRNLEKHKLSQCKFFIPSFRTIAGF